MNESHQTPLSGTAHPITKKIFLWQKILLAFSLCLTQAGQTATLTPLMGVNQLWKGGGSFHSCALTASGGVKCWGRNDYGQLGDNSTTDRGTPVDVTGLTNGVVAIALGAYRSCALTTSGGMKCWGRNDYGQLGDNSTTDRWTPVDVIGLTNGVVAIALGYDHTCALTASGGVKCWGKNDFGQLGDNGAAVSLTPVDITGLTNGVVAIALGWRHSCALTTNGGVKCWGWNDIGQLGDNGAVVSLTPVDVTGLTNGVTAIASGGIHSCALTTSGGVKCWGGNNYGQLGDNSKTDRLTPVDVTGLTNGVAAIALGTYNSSCALTASGGVKCWGYNYYGQLGDNSTTERRTPVNVTGLTNGVAAIALGEYHSCALTASGGVKCWGYNYAGQLGDNSTTERRTPVDVLIFLDLPDLEVQGNSIPILSGHTTPSLSEGTDFGQVRIETQGNRTFTLHNSGGGTLNLLGSSTISCSGGITPSSNLTGVSIDPLSSYSLSISLTPHAISSETCTVTLFNDDPDENPYTFTLAIQGVDPPTLTVPPQAESTLSTETTGTAMTEIALPDTTSPITPPTLSLEVSIEGLGEVDMSSQKSHLRCTKEHQPCWERYDTGTVITLVPIAASGYAFSSWGGHDDCTDGQVTLLESSRLCVAYFRKLLELNVGNIGEGKVIGEGIDCGNECTKFYATGTSVTLVAIPNQNSIFKAWQGDCDETGHTVMNTRKSCQAVFVARLEPLPDPSSSALPIEPVPFVPPTETIEPLVQASSLVMSPSPEEAVTHREPSDQEIPSLPPVTLEIIREGEGEIQSEPAGIICGPTCTQDYLPGTSVMLTAIPANGFTFTGWSEHCEGLALITTVLMNTPQRCVAHFSPMPLMPFINPVEEEQFPCPPEEMLNWICNAQGRTLKQELEIRSWGNLSNAVVIDSIHNQGWASNLVVQPSGEVVGGTLTGYISNAGLLKNFEFRGAAIFGGTLAGEIINTSEVGGYFQEVHLAAHTHLIGGRLKGRIIGDPEAPASLDHLTIMSGSHLSGVKLGQEVVVQKNVIIEP